MGSEQQDTYDIVFPNVDLQYKKVDSGVEITVSALTNRQGEHILQPGMFDFELFVGQHSLKIWPQQHRVILTDMPTKLFACMATKQVITNARAKLTVVIRVASGPLKGSSNTSEFVIEYPESASLDNLNGDYISGMRAGVLVQRLLIAEVTDDEFPQNSG